MSAHGFRRHPRAARAALLIFGALVLPLILLEALLRVAPSFIDHDRSGPLGSGAKRIVCVGDSNTYGVFFPASASYPARLQSRLDAALGASIVSVLSAGKPGRPTSEMRSLLPELLARVRPDFVVVLGGFNDRWNHVLASAPLQFLADHSRLFKGLRVWLAARSRGRLDDDWRGDLDSSNGAIFLDDATLREQVDANLRAIAALVRESGATPIFLTYPAGVPAFVAPNDGIRAAAAATSTRLIDLTALFAREQAARPEEKLLIAGDDHPYPTGYDLMASAVAESLLEELGRAPRSGRSEPAGSPPAARAIELTIAEDAPSTLLVRTPPRRSFRIVLSRTRMPRLRLGSCELDLGDDEFARLSLKVPWLRGVADASGRARVELPADALGSCPPGADGLRAAAVLLDAEAPPRADVRIWAESTSDAVLLRPASQPEK